MKGLLSAAAEAMGGTLLGAGVGFEGISTDTRSLQPGELFFALEGPNFDGTEFVSQAAKLGAAAAVVTREVSADIAQLVVDDTREALGRLATHWRLAHSARIVGITGSNGKTTLKEMTAACLSRAGKTFATRGNFNNDIGVPLMLAELTPQHEFAVIEMGANHVGEIAYLTMLAQPDVVAISNAGPAHLEGFGSLDGVARGKGEILCGKPRPRVAVLNADDPYLEFWRGSCSDIDVLTFGFGQLADVRATDVEMTDNGSRFTLHLPLESRPVSLSLDGRHNVVNACAAAAIATALGVAAGDIAAALAAVAAVGGRLQALPGRSSSTLFDDSYNANPTSVKAAAEYLASRDGTRCFVLGDMGELGERAAELHREVGQVIRNAGVNRLLATGELCKNAVEGFGDGADWFADIDDLIATLEAELGPGVTVLVKGSRSARMERVVDALRSDTAARQAC